LTTPAFGVGILTTKTKVTSAGQALVTLDCPANSLDRCAGELALTAKVKKRKREAAKRKTIKLGKATFEIPAGTQAPVAVPISKKGVRAIQAAGRKGLKATATATASDAAANQGVTTATLTIKRGKRR
jgi:hypothetical protein